MEIPKDWIEECAKKLLELSDDLEDKSMGEVQSIGDETAVEWATACLAAVLGRASVVYKNETDGPADVLADGEFRVCTLPGDTLVIVRGC